MKHTNEAKRYGAELLCLLGVLVVTLIGAKVLVAIRSEARLTGPITIPDEGVSVKLVRGDGWNNQDSWSYTDDQYVLTSFFIPYGRQPLYSISYEYLAADPNHPDAYFQQVADKYQGTIRRQNQTQIDGEDAWWVHMTFQRKLPDLFLAIVKRRRPDRMMRIRFEDRSGDTDRAEAVFRTLLEHIAFDPPQQMSRSTAALRHYFNTHTAIEHAWQRKAKQ